MDNRGTHSLKHVARSESFGFQPCRRAKLMLSSVTSVVQPLDHGIIASVKVQHRTELLEWIFSWLGLVENNAMSLEVRGKIRGMNHPTLSLIYCRK
jgi:hypothetical protein